MKTLSVIKVLAVAVAVTATMSISEANANDRFVGSSSCSMGGCRITPPIPVLGIYGYPTHSGMVVTDVVRGSEAWNIGLERGDVIVEIDGRHIHSQRDYDIAMRRTGNHTLLRVLDVRCNRVVTVEAHLFGRLLPQ